jgi:hypothetical protein
MKVGDLVRHIYTGKLYLVATRLSAELVTLVGFPPNQAFNTHADLETVNANR